MHKVSGLDFAATGQVLRDRLRASRTNTISHTYPRG